VVRLTPGDRDDGSPRQRDRRAAVVRLVAELVVVGVLVVGAVALVAVEGTRVSHDLRELLMRLSPLRGVVFALVVGVVGALLLAWPRSRPPPRTARPGQLPVVALLGLVVVAAATFRLVLGRAATEPRVFGDELVYSGLAKGLALEGQPLLRGAVDSAHSMLYPLLIAPTHLLGGDGARAFELTKSVNAIVVASAAVPAYLLARRVVSPLFALAVAYLVAFEPWTAYASLVMTESLFLPAFTAFVLLLARMLDRPTLGRQLAVLASLALLIGTRPQGVALVGAVLAALAINGLRAPPFRRTLVVYRPLLAILGVGIGAAVVAMALGDDAPGGVSGGVLEGLLDPVGLLTWSSWTVAVLGLALGVVALVLYPFALESLLRSPVERDRATGVALLTSSLALLLSVAAVSASPYGLDVLHERYLFYLTPLVLVGLAYRLETGHVLSGRALWVAGLGAIAVAASLPADQVARANNVDSPTAAWLNALHEELPDVPVRVLVVALAALGVVVLVLFRGRLAPFVAVAVAFTIAVGALDYSGALAPGTERRLAWVDRALPGDATASLVHLGYSRPDQPCGAAADYEQQGLDVLTEFFNTRVAGVFHLGTESIERDNLASPALNVGDGGVVLADRGRPFAPRYVVLDSRQPVVGRRLARLDLADLESQYQSGSSLTLWEVEPPLRFLVHAQPLPPRADGRAC
jgi:hypothetical protein